MTAMITPLIIMMTSSSTISIKIIIVGTTSACRTSSTTGIGIMTSITA
ncbi:hypothetical protein CI1B_31250 [Bradyrhizobium ivorense]|uniref:Uncharacterized protein n=1 Tax=Bradyrhizobium ivorense TaxID=2511166 RepID=A0A508T8E2_9BRAD|nr:hypothetical protein [Bradyrhizobium ivorense]VIO70471.1 hypothetical protein CI1B_31250 [Bradyrhizobium ivorense]VIO79146.1 hypothetical protein CI41S_67140 [Bradyrhizobium ivorense]